MNVDNSMNEEAVLEAIINTPENEEIIDALWKMTIVQNWSIVLDRGLLSIIDLNHDCYGNSGVYAILFGKLLKHIMPSNEFVDATLNVPKEYLQTAVALYGHQRS